MHSTPRQCDSFLDRPRSFPYAAPSRLYGQEGTVTHSFGIDLGTTNSEIAYLRDGKPVVVAIGSLKEISETTELLEKALEKGDMDALKTALHLAELIAGK